MGECPLKQQPGSVHYTWSTEISFTAHGAPSVQREKKEKSMNYELRIYENAVFVRLGARYTRVSKKPKTQRSVQSSSGQGGAEGGTMT